MNNRDDENGERKKTDLDTKFQTDPYLLNRLRSIWLGKWFLFQTFDDLKEGEQDTKAIKDLLAEAHYD